MRTVAIGLLLVAATVQAGTPTVDWASGLVTAEGIGLANRHAPNPAVARGTSRRDAEAAAKKQLAAKLPSLPLASGGTLADKLKDKAVAARIAEAVEHAVTVAADPETDGSWRVTLGVPLEAVRQALAGPRAVAVAGADSGPPVVILEGVTAKPAIGSTIGASEAATLWVKDVPAWAKDAPHAKAKSAKGGAITVDGINATAATLFVIITGS